MTASTFAGTIVLLKDAVRYLEEFCRRIVSLHPTVRFVGIADYAGKLHASAYRKGLVPLIDKAQTERYALQTVFRARSRGEFTAQVGEQRYATAVYDKLIRATITIYHPEAEFRNMYLLVSFDVGCEYTKAIEEHLLPFLSENRKTLFSNTHDISSHYSYA